MIAPRTSLLPLWASLSLVFICGCGSVPQSTTTTTTSANASVLSGNWLLAGSMPTGYTLTSTALSVTATFDVNGTAISGIVQVAVPCVTVAALGTPLIVQGTVAADGSLTLNSVPVAGLAQMQTFTLQGKVPSVAGGPWTGTFSFTNSGTACTGTTSGAVNATSVPSVTGPYSSNASLGNPLNNTLQSVGLKLALQQGATLAAGAYSNLPLAGTISVSNSTCITSGTTVGSPLTGFVEGAQVGATFLMNDGSTVLMDGQITNQNSSVVSAILFTTNMGTCGLSFNSSLGILTLSR